MGRKLFIFEPYEWPYCGGTLGVIALSFDEAVKLLVYKYRDFRPEHFKENKEEFKEDYYDQWLLTHTVATDWEEESYIMFANWNYA